MDDDTTSQSNRVDPKSSPEDIISQNKALSLQVTELTVAMAKMEALHYNLAHDLKTPVIGIAGLIKILLDEYADRLPEEGQRYLKLIQKASEKMGLLIDERAVSRGSRSI